MIPSPDNETETVPPLGVAGLLTIIIFAFSFAFSFAIGVVLGAMVAMAIFTK